MIIEDPNTTAPDLVRDSRAERRRFLKLTGGSTAAIAGLSLLAACGSDDDASAPTPTPSASPTPAPTSGTFIARRIGLLQVALNLKYLQAQFFSVAAFGRRLPDASLSGPVGTKGDVIGGRKIAFTDETIASFAREIATDEIAQVGTLRALLTAASATVVISQPAIDIGEGASGPFSTAARAAGVVGPSDTFDPYASDENFLLAAFLFKDLSVSALKGVAALSWLDDFSRPEPTRVNLEPALGLVGTESYHAGMIRTELFARGGGARVAANKVAAYRGTLEGGASVDAGVSRGDETAIAAPIDSNGFAWSRSSAQLHNVVYLRTTAGVGGGFFPGGTNNSLESLRTSAAVG